MIESQSITMIMAAAEYDIKEFMEELKENSVYIHLSVVNL